MKTKQVLEMFDSLKKIQMTNEILLQNGQITSVQMKLYQKEHKDLYIRSRHEQLLTRKKNKMCKSWEEASVQFCA